VGGGLPELGPGESAIVPVTHAGVLPASGSVAIQITAMAFTPESEVMYESTSASAGF
jgi:hypothetical protein